MYRVAIGHVGAWLRERLPGGELPVAVGSSRGATAVRTTPAPGGRWTTTLLADSRPSTSFSLPMHQPNNLRPIRAIQQSFPGMLQVVCFDTAFHRGHLEVADRLRPAPELLYEEGVRRYGFHGLSYEYIARTLPSRRAGDRPRQGRGGTPRQRGQHVRHGDRE